MTYLQKIQAGYLDTNSYRYAEGETTLKATVIKFDTLVHKGA